MMKTMQKTNGFGGFQKKNKFSMDFNKINNNFMIDDSDQDVYQASPSFPATMIKDEDPFLKLTSTGKSGQAIDLGKINNELGVN